MGRVKLLKCKCRGEAEAISDGLWYIRCVECGEESRSWVFLREASKEWNQLNGSETK